MRELKVGPSAIRMSLEPGYDRHLVEIVFPIDAMVLHLAPEADPLQVAIRLARGVLDDLETERLNQVISQRG